MVNFVRVYSEMVENKEKQVKDLTKQIEELKAENDALRQKISDLNNQNEEHVKKCLCCKNFNFTQEIKFLNNKIHELKSEIYNQREEHVNQCLTCDKFDFVRKISELESQVEELKEANNRTNVVSNFRGKSLINERDRTAELENVLKDIFNKISEVLK